MQDFARRHLFLHMSYFLPAQQKNHIQEVKHSEAMPRSCSVRLSKTQGLANGSIRNDLLAIAGAGIRCVPPPTQSLQSAPVLRMVAPLVSRWMAVTEAAVSSPNREEAVRSRSTILRLCIRFFGCIRAIFRTHLHTRDSYDFRIDLIISSTRYAFCHPCLMTFLWPIKLRSI